MKYKTVQNFSRTILKRQMKKVKKLISLLKFDFFKV